MTTSNALLFALLALASTACGASGSTDGDSEASGSDSATDGNLPPRQAPPVGGPAETSELTEAFGVFVTTSGTPDAVGTREHPLSSVQAAIDLGKREGKRVYVCAGTFHESLVVADSISIIGGLDCSGPAWRTSEQRSRIEAPTSPALRADAITKPTRIEGLEIIAPAASAAAGPKPSTSSIALIADHAATLTIARTKLVAQNAADGVDGIEGIALTNAPTANGMGAVSSVACTPSTCTRVGSGYVRSPGAAAGTNTCVGAPGHVAQAGGAGGSGGLWESAAADGTHYIWRLYENSIAFNLETGDKSRTSANGASGSNGSNGTAGALSLSGFTPANGTAGTNGAPGMGGAGGGGSIPSTSAETVSGAWRGWNGAGGGAGGCPGLAGAPGTGGGASIAALLFDSPVTFDASELTSGRGGTGGHGTFGSAPTMGGHAGAGFPAVAVTLAKDGGHGGSAGISGNGASGPSLGIAHSGAAPVLLNNSMIRPGAGGAALPARSHTDALGNTATIAATPAGASHATLSL